jgi:pyruvate formate lyase activating enzyme
MGRIQSIQSFSTVDGPGTRCVVFLQGCPVGCIFCHNPGGWAADGGEEMDIDQLLLRLERFRPFLYSPGLTVSGGEPMMQPDFTLDLIQSAKNEGWHVALDTSGWGPVEAFLKVAGTADLVIFSIKHPLTPEKLIHCDPESLKTNWQALTSLTVPVILRYVLIPGWTDQPEALAALGALVKAQPNLERVEVLPFNSLAGDKWAGLGRGSPLFNGNKLNVTEAQLQNAEEIIKKYI